MTLGVAIGFALCLGVAAGADVNYERVKTKVQFRGIDVNGSETTFSGKLRSRKHACVKKRRGIYVSRVGDLGVVGNDRADRKGNWEFTRATAGLEDGTYEAHVRAIKVFKSDEEFKCKGGAATSETDDLP